MQPHLVRNLKGKLYFVVLSCLLLLIAIKSSTHEQHPQVPELPQIQGRYGGSDKPSQTKLTSTSLQAGRFSLSYFDLSSLENDLLESSENSEDDMDYVIDNITNVADDMSVGHTWPSFVVNTTSQRFRHGCYERGTIKQRKELLPEKMLEELNCEQRPPKVIVFGVKKGGTTALKEFLAFHPEVSVAPTELKFLNNRQLTKQGLSKYTSLMPYSLPSQIPIEKTPGYMVRERCAVPLKEMIPDCKLIAILSDPVRRAISDFVHLSWVRDNRKNGASELAPRHAHQIPHYEVNTTFEDSVLYPNGSVKTWNTLIDTSMYYKYAKFWLDYFPPENFLYLDAKDLVENPVNSFKELEKFLGLSPFFSEEVFHFNKTKGFYCIQYPVYSCMPSAKGRPHPVVKESVLKNLQEFFEPHNKAFSQLVNKTFSWTTYPDRS